MSFIADTRRYFLFFVRLHDPLEHPDVQCFDSPLVAEKISLVCFAGTATNSARKGVDEKR
jgi:hypothetical protein